MTTAERLRTRSDEPRRLGIRRARSVGFGPTRSGDVLVGPGAGRPTEWAGRTAAGPDGMERAVVGAGGLRTASPDAAPRSPHGSQDAAVVLAAAPSRAASERGSFDRHVEPGRDDTVDRTEPGPRALRRRRASGSGHLQRQRRQLGELSTTDEPTWVPSAEPSPPTTVPHRPRSRTAPSRRASGTARSSS